jgi:hypothetical protein
MAVNLHRQTFDGHQEPKRRQPERQTVGPLSRETLGTIIAPGAGQSQENGEVEIRVTIDEAPTVAIRETTKNYDAGGLGLRGVFICEPKNARARRTEKVFRSYPPYVRCNG